MPPHLDTSMVPPLAQERRAIQGPAKLGARTAAKRPAVRQALRGKDFLQRLREAGL